MHDEIKLSHNEIQSLHNEIKFSHNVIKMPYMNGMENYFKSGFGVP